MKISEISSDNLVKHTICHLLKTEDSIPSGLCYELNEVIEISCLLQDAGVKGLDLKNTDQQCIFSKKTNQIMCLVLFVWCLSIKVSSQNDLIVIDYKPHNLLEARVEASRDDCLLGDCLLHCWVSKPDGRN